MPSEVFVLVGAVIGALAAYMTARVTARTQIDIARLNARKDIALQKDRLFDERLRNEILAERGKLDLLHRILSRIALENSQTMSFFQSSSKLTVDEFRIRYINSCDRLHEAMAVADIFYPRMSAGLRKIYGQMNIFWGYQENLLRLDVNANYQQWQSVLSEVLKASNAIDNQVHEIKQEIAGRAKELVEAMAVRQCPGDSDIEK